MIVRSVLRSSATRRLQVFRPKQPQLQVTAKSRRFSTSSSSPPVAGNTQSPVPMLGAFTNELDRIAPKFEVDGSQIQVLQSPAEFYETLKNKIRTAEKRIFLSTLYIGKTEHELISTLQSALRATPNLKLSVLTDALRGTRESPNASCASLLVPLVEEFGNRVEIRMYHTPNLTGFRKKNIPKRINEGWGLQHMKLYGFDDEIIISGANLSNDYFTNRQDRYHLFSSKEVTDYFLQLHNAVSKLSFLVVPDANAPAAYNLTWPSSNLAPNPLDSPGKYISASSSLLTSLIQPSQNALPSKGANTTIYPLSQLTPLLKPDTSTELPAVTSLLRALSSSTYAGSSWTFTAGYFNPHPLLTSLLIKSSSRNNTVITASPWANGFYGSSGISGLLPSAYTLLSRRFLEAVHRRGRSNDIVLREWRKGTVGEADGWTYHAKGLWISLNPIEKVETAVDISVVGSSNYTKRSYSLDLEAGVAIVTSDEGLKKRLADERDWLRVHAKEVGMDEFIKTERRVGIRVRIAMWIVSIVGGAL